MDGRTFLPLVAASLALSLARPLAAQETKIKLKVADSFPPTHYVPGFAKKWMQDVTEASGNMALPRIAEVAATGVDYISSGALTHSARTLDLGLDF